MRRLIDTSIGVVGAILLCGSLARAHEIGTTRVSVLLHADRYDIEVVTDAAALLQKLEASAGRRPGPEDFADIFQRRLEIAFDGAVVHSAVEYSVSPPTDATLPALATIRLRGNVPRSAREFNWTYSWTFASYALTIRAAGSGTPVIEWLEGGQRSAPFALSEPVAAGSRVATVARYFALGFTHIVPNGLDHVLFVLGIFLLSGGLRVVFWQVSAFTIAHSITLGLTMNDLLAAPPALVEPLIALSIAYVAIENVFLSELKPWRVALVFAFGLLHGMGFAGVLKEIGLQGSTLLEALLFFNAGVEAGQLTVLAAAFALVGMQWGTREWYRRRVVVPASLLIACCGIYWTVQRIAV
jgi:hypothetical protein